MLFFVFVFLLFNGAAASKQLAFVQAVWRHGDRAPLGLPYPNDRYGEKDWPRGFGELTNLGMQQLKVVGGFFKQRYAGTFVDKRFNHKQVYLRSSDSDRALVSAQSLLNGFFPPSNNEDKFESGLNWQPIAVHASSPNEPDPLLKPTAFDCPNYNTEFDQIKKPLFESWTTKYQKLLDFLTTAAGYKSPITIEEVATLNDANREITHNLTQPDWMYKKWPEYDNNSTLQIITEIGRMLRMAEFDDTTLAYLRGGFLLNDWMRRAQRVASGNQTDPSKVLLYSSHDGTLLALMYLLKVANGQMIAYGGSVLMEVYKHSDGYFLEFYYYHNGELTRLCVGGCCHDRCSLKSFVDQFEDKTIATVEDLNDMCAAPWTQFKRQMRRLKRKHTNRSQIN
ncbi:Testicular acid phosphatase-like protein [Aphelenchoides bicaudatus]|nr:Testicular acid phosphatase-like protein [Aphelenchoides bicaudatus]